MDISRIDHIVYAFPNLEDGIVAIEKLTGVTPVLGGQHLNNGTHNALMALGPNCYLELIAPDPKTKFVGERWMAVDNINEPTITRWSINTQNISEDSQTLSSIKQPLGEIIIGQRQLKNGKFLKWKMTKPNIFGLVETVPFLLDWSQSNNHPCDTLDIKCELLSIQLVSQNINDLDSVLGKSSDQISYIQGNHNRIKITLNTKRGIVVL
jgi:hypothetical protein